LIKKRLEEEEKNYGLFTDWLWSHRVHLGGHYDHYIDGRISKYRRSRGLFSLQFFLLAADYDISGYSQKHYQRY
jgi:hypothetical protein